MQISAIKDITLHNLAGPWRFIVPRSNMLNSLRRKRIGGYFEEGSPKCLHLCLVGCANHVFKCVDKAIQFCLLLSFLISFEVLSTVTFDCFINMPAAIKMMHIWPQMCFYYCQCRSESFCSIRQHNSRFKSPMIKNAIINLEE